MNNLAKSRISVVRPVRFPRFTPSSLPVQPIPAVLAAPSKGLLMIQEFHNKGTDREITVGTVDGIRREIF